MFCYKCGSEVMEGQRFCNKCGADMSFFQAKDESPLPVSTYETEVPLQQPEQTAVPVQTPVQDPASGFSPVPISVPVVRKKSGPVKKLIISIVAAALVGGAVFGVIELLNRHSEDEIKIPDSITKDEFIDNIHKVYGDDIELNGAPLIKQYLALDPVKDKKIIEQFSISKYINRFSDTPEREKGVPNVFLWDSDPFHSDEIEGLVDECHYYEWDSNDYTPDHGPEDPDDPEDEYYKNRWSYFYFAGVDYYEFEDDTDAHDALIKHFKPQRDKNGLSSDEYYSSESYSYFKERRSEKVTSGTVIDTRWYCIYQVHNTIIVYSLDFHNKNSDDYMDECFEKLTEFVESIGLEVPDSSIEKEWESSALPDSSGSFDKLPSGNTDTKYYKSLKKKGRLTSEELADACEEVFGAADTPDVLELAYYVTDDNGNKYTSLGPFSYWTIENEYDHFNGYWSSKVTMGDRVSYETDNTYSAFRFCCIDKDNFCYSVDFFSDGKDYKGETADIDKLFARMIDVGCRYNSAINYNDETLMINDDYSYMIGSINPSDELYCIFRIGDDIMYFRATGDIDYELVDEFFEYIDIMSPTKVQQEFWE